MSERPQYFLDTETTGLVADGDDRIVEIGAIEYINREPTGRVFHVYIDPKRDVPEDAYEVHKLSRDDLVRLSGGKVFKNIASDFIDFVKGGELIAHNAKFDVGFLNAELARNGFPTLDKVGVVVTDSLAIANMKFPRQVNTLDALLKRLIGSSNYERQYHGALLDASLLARVYLAMTVQQKSLHLDKGLSRTHGVKFDPLPVVALPVAEVSSEELERNAKLLERVKKTSKAEPVGFSFDI